MFSMCCKDKSLKTKSSSVSVSVRAVNFCVDRTIIVSKSVDPEKYFEGDSKKIVH